MNEQIDAYILLTVEIDKVEKVLKEIRRKIKNVKSADAVTGPYDAILRVTSSSIKELTKIILPKIYTIEGVIDTTTAIVIPE